MSELQATTYDPTAPTRPSRGLGSSLVAGNTILVRDSDGNEVEAADVLFVGLSVSEDPDEEGQTAIIEGNTGVKSLLNNSGEECPQYGVVVNDPDADDAFTFSTTQGVSGRAVGVAQQLIAAGETGPVMFGGYTPILVDDSTVRGDFVETSTTAWYAHTASSREEGSFGVVMKGVDPDDATPEGDPVVDSAVTTLDVAGTSITFDMPDLRPDAIGYLLALYTDGTSPTVTGWTRIGSTANQFYYTRAGDDEPATYSASWTGSSVAVAVVLALDPNVNPASIVAGNAYDATNSAAVLSGLADTFYLAIAGVKAFSPNKDGWESLASASVEGSGTTGSLEDKAHSQGTVSFDPNSDWGTVTTPQYCNDANDGTAGSIGASVQSAGTRRGFLVDLGTACEIHTIRLKSQDNKSNTLDEFYYSDDAVTWSGGDSSSIGTWSGFGTDATLTLTSPLTARYWRYDREHTGGFAAQLKVWSLELIGYQVSQDVAGSLVAKYIKGTGVTSPFSGATESVDAVVAFNLLVDPLMALPPPAVLVWGGDPDTAGGSFSGVAEDLTTTETDTDKRLAPDGVGGVEWVAEAAAGGLGWFNVIDYGAVGDGSADDTTAVSAAITALTSAGKGVLYFPAGSYKTSGGFTLSVPCLVLGDGMDVLGGTPGVSEVLCTSQTAVLFTVTTDSCRFAQLGLVNSYAGNASAGSAVYTNSANDWQKVDYETVMVHGFYDGLDIKVGQAWEVHNVYVRDVVRYGVRVRNTVTADAGDWSIIGCHSFQNLRSCTSAIRIESAGGGKIVNCKINSGTNHQQHGIDIAPTSSTSVLLIANNSIENVTGDAIHGSIGAGVIYSAIVIGNNQVGLYSNNTGKAISLVATSAGGFFDILIGGNSLRTTGTARSAMQFTNVDNVVVMPQILDGFNATYTATTCTNVHDFTIEPVATAFATPTIVLGTAAAAGAASTVIRSDSTIEAFDATAPTTSAVGDAAAAGSSGHAARRDHGHGREAFGSPVAVGTANADGTATSVARSDHVHEGSSGTAFIVIGQEERTSDGATVAWTLDNDFEEFSVSARNLTTGHVLSVTETLPNTVTISAAGTAGDKIAFGYAASVA